MIRALFAGPAALRALRAEERAGSVEFVLARGAYLSFGEDWVGVSVAEAPFGPLSLVVERLPWLTDGTPVALRGPVLWLGDAPVSLERMRPRDPARLSDGALPEELPPAPPALEPGVEALRAGDVERGVAALAGLGPGLTPAGDDVLAGYAGATRERLSHLAAGRSSPLGLAYLRAAERGELPDPCARLRFADWGASSGTAFGWGLAAARAARSLRSAA